MECTRRKIFQFCWANLNESFAERLATGQPTWRNPTERKDKFVWYADAVGTEPAVADVISATSERTRDNRVKCETF